MTSAECKGGSKCLFGREFISIFITTWKISNYTFLSSVTEFLLRLYHHVCIELAAFDATKSLTTGHPMISPLRLPENSPSRGVHKGGPGGPRAPPVPLAVGKFDAAEAFSAI